MPNELDCLKCDLPACNEKDPGCQFYKITRSYTPRAKKWTPPAWKVKRDANRLARQARRDAEITAEADRRERKARQAEARRKFLDDMRPLLLLEI